jgi:hypothetical protein
MGALSELKYEVPATLARFVGAQASREAKLAAARGMLPLPPRDLVQILFALTREPDAEIKETAGKSLANMPENILNGICEDVSTHPLILDFLAHALAPESKLQEAIALNRSTHDETCMFQASLPIKRVVDIISENQLRILRCPEIVDALAENLLTGQAQLERILKFIELETRRSARKSGAGDGMEVEVEQVEEPEEEKGAEADEEEQLEDMEEVPAVTEGGEEEEISAVTIEELGGESPWARMTFDEELLKDHKVETEEEIEELETNLYKRIQNMKVSQKIKLALMGGASARSILIKDANKMVSTAVLKSPRITQNEIEGISRSRSVNEDVIRLISGSREWTKSYQVKINLVSNPKTPVQESFRFLNFLRDKDLRDLSRSRNVPNQVSTQAKRLLQRKEQKGKPGAAKH